MGLFDRIKNELIDIIEWVDDSNNTMVYRFERFQNEIKMGAKLTVREGQVAVFINEGKIADVYNPGLHTLNTQNMPVLTTLKGWKYGFNSPFKAEVYFVSTRNITAQKWGTKNAITLSDPRFGMLEIRSFGTYVLRVNDAALFIREIVGTDGHFTSEEIAEQLKSLIVTRFTDAVGESGFPVEAFAAKLNELSDFVHEAIKPDFSQYGLDLTKFLIENISMPEEIKKEIFELSRLNSIDLNKLTQMKAAKSMEAAANNPSGTAGAGMGMGMGFAIANQMVQQFTHSQHQKPAGPPPVPGCPPALAYFVSVGGQQTGPFDMGKLKEMAGQQQFNKESLVWREGMGNWTAAGELGELKEVFGSIPPPIPG